MNKKNLLPTKLKQVTNILPESIEDRMQREMQRTSSFVSEFKKFAVKGNVVDLAVGIIIGAAFTSIVNSLVKDIITPIIGALTGRVDFSNLYINLTDQSFETLSAAEEAGAAIIRYGQFIDAVINFIIVSLVLFVVIKYFIGQKKKEEVKEKIVMKKCVECFEDIKPEAKRCKYCTAEQPQDE